MGTLSSPGIRIRGRKGVKLRKRRMARSNWLCEHCLAKGITRLATIVNHKLALAHGGADVDENTENLCDECDAVVTAEQFGHRLKQEIGVDGWPM
jgi:5-methylcytosine-specific restriction protein A